MKPKLLSFDAAGTLIDVNWHPGRFAVECAEKIGWKIDPQVGIERYERLLATRWPDYCALNETRDDNLCDGFWKEVGEDWLRACNLPQAEISQLVDAADQGLYGPHQTIFKLYSDALPTLRRMRSLGYRMIVLSNWDYSLHRVLRVLAIADFFDFAFASLQEGPEKPDRALFDLVVKKMEVEPESIVHIGDHPIDDLEGARMAGWKAIFLDRALPRSSKPIISSLNDLPEAFEWLN